MKTNSRRVVLTFSAAGIAILASLLLITALSLAQAAKGAEVPKSTKEIASSPARVLEPSQGVSVTFPPGPWPWYAQEEISIHPEPPIAHHPTEICAVVINHDPVNVHTATLEFGVANFGIGVPFGHVGAVDVEVPPSGHAQGCVVWVPPGPGPWCIEALLFQKGAIEPERSLRNIDVWEPLVPGQPHETVFPVGPFVDIEGNVTLSVTNLLPGWDVNLNPSAFFLNVNTTQMVTLTTWPPIDAVLGSREPIVDIEGSLNREPIGGFRKLDAPPVLLHRLKDPFYAESEISIWPYPVRAEEPTELCVELFNMSDQLQIVQVQFSWANFGIGLPFDPIAPPIEVEIPPHSHVPVCIGWIPPFDGRFCIQVEMNILGDVPYHPQFSQRNIDVGEPLVPGEPHTLAFPVGNPLPNPVTITLGLVPHLHDWGLELSEDVLPNMDQTEQRVVSLTVTPPRDVPLPPDETVIVDVEAFVEGELLGGFRKTHRPRVILHRFPDPPYAEREISIHPYPPMAGEPTEICVELHNPTPWPQDVEVQFSWANFGIGLPFTPINGLRPVHLPPHSIVNECIHWIPPVDGHMCLQVELLVPGEEPQRSQRNIDVYEPLVPGEPHTLPFSVGNPLDHPVDVELGFIPHLDRWEYELLPNFLPDMAPGAVREVSLTVIPPPGVPLPPDGTVVVDVEAFAEGELIGGFRKIHRPRVPLHPFPDPPYAEREITVHPYPPEVGEPTEVCVELHNPTPEPQEVVVQFSWANFGIGLPFMPINGLRPVHLPPHSMVRECIYWIPPVSGHVCLQVELFMEGEEPQRSQRNIDVYEPLVPGVSHTLPFSVGNPLDHPVDVELGFIPHLDRWEYELLPNFLPDMAPGAVREVSLTVIPPPGVPLPPDGTVVVDVEAFAEGELIGGFRKIHRPRVPLHPWPDPPYAEREITVHPYPTMMGEPTEICVELHNPTPEPQEVVVQFSWANFGIGLPFMPINGPRVVVIPPFGMIRECIHWIPPVSGHVCLQVELFMEGEEPQRSQRNIDVDEPLVPGESHTRQFPVGNPLDHAVDIQLGLVPHLDGWEFDLSPAFLPNVDVGQQRMVSLTVMPPPGVPLPPDGTVVVDVEAFAEGELIGGFRKRFRPEVPLHPWPDPFYAEREITVHPYPTKVGEPTEVCVELRNPTDDPHEVVVQFSWANFGIGLPFTPINGLRPVHLLPHSVVNECIHWVPPVGGHVCLQVELLIPGREPQRSQRNIDVDEPLRPNEPHPRFFPVGNPFDHPVTITLGFVPHLDGWDVQLVPDVLPDMPPGHVEEVLLTVTPPGELPPDEHPVVDIEAFVDGELIGGFRKIFRPEVPVHVPGDPVYAEREIFVHPYPPRAFEPTELAVEIRNPTDEWQTVEVLFSVAPFGIGLPFDPVHEPILVEVPPAGMVVPGTMWVPPHEGLWCIQVEIFIPDHDEPFWSRLNLDVGEPLEPNVPHSRPFRVGSWPHPEPVTITLGLIPHFPDWGLELSEDVLPNVKPGEVREVILTVTPPDDLPADGDPIVDVEAFVEGELLGGFRKIFRPPVPLHRPKDSIYAESEIGIDPYPVLPGQPVELSVEVFNPTDEDHVVTATFSVAPFGIGLPFSTAHITPNPVLIFVPAHGAARGHVVWRPPLGIHGKFCVQVELELPGHEKIWSQRNMDVGEPLEPGRPHSLTFPVGRGSYTQPVTITLGLINHRDDFGTDLSSDSFFDVFYEIEVDNDKPVTVTLTVTPSPNARLGTGEPIVDVEAFVEGELLGGFRKLDIPPIPLHKPHEKNYAETELRIVPDPPRLGQPAQIGAVMQNNGPTTSTILLEFGYARFGVGVPFTTTNMVPPTRTLTLGPIMTDTAWVTWTPTFSGSHCVMVKLIDPDGDYEDIVSQRNVRVVDRPPCGTTRTFTLILYNDRAVSVTVDLGLITFDVPEEWEVTTVPSGTVELESDTELVVEVRVRIPCPGTLQLMRDVQEMYSLQEQAGGVPTINVEGYVDGELVGGIELQFEAAVPEPEKEFVYLPVVLRTWP